MVASAGAVRNHSQGLGVLMPEVSRYTYGARRRETSAKHVLYL